MLKKLYLHHFRSYEKREFTFQEGINVIRGDNACGKTNLLEAVYLLSTGRSFRTTQLTDLIRHGHPFFYLEADFASGPISQHLKVSFDGQVKRVEHDGATYSQFTPLLGLFPTVLHVPEDIELVTGAPTERRRFLDLHIAQIDPLYIFHLARYFKAMRQRNVLLRQHKETAIESWEQILLTSGHYLQQKRREVLLSLQPPLAEAMLRLSDSIDNLLAEYRPSTTDDYKKSRTKEMQLGATLIGPHRDDFYLTINGQDAQGFASQGQQRCAAAALRLAQWRHFATLLDTPPLVGIDDFGVHLDAKRSRALLHEIEPMGQVFVTCPHDVKMLGKTLSLYELEIGSI